MKPLAPGALRDQLAIRRYAETDNGKGGYIAAWSTIGQPWAQVLGQQGREGKINEALQSISVFQIRIWYREDVNAGDQVRYGSIDLNIKSCTDPFGTRRELLIIADTDGVRADPRT